jgi:hypothetical protein
MSDRERASGHNRRRRFSDVAPTLRASSIFVEESQNVYAGELEYL